MAVPPTVFYTDYGIQLVCALIIVLLNPVTLYRHVKSKAGCGHYSLLLTHIGFHSVFGFFTLIWACTVLLHKAHTICIWTGILHLALHPAIGVVDVFLALDRLISMVFPVHYMMGIRRKLLYSAVLTGSFIYGAFLGVYISTTNDKSHQTITVVNYVSRNLMRRAYILNMLSIAINMVLSVILLFVMWKYYHRSAVDRVRSEKLANSIVLHQTILKFVFWFCPTLLKVISEYGYHINLTSTWGPITITTFLVYIACCSVLYWMRFPLRRDEDDEEALCEG
ncbi:hypothetical protein QR680_015640 [Steinernema hermaphroditum]|uniref:G-protein coupled receptors family 1 profile domain-containing protein n=1 Tax=Steinernema hermaphroditum TaxID=289476 RepID=A0AA39HAP5_9BILA|nr:hypothetical protein QR680_015640 [Steinernema hermaphroditum]